MQLINLFPAHVFEIILVDLGGFESERLNTAQILEVFLCKDQLGKCRRRKKSDLFKALVLISENKLGNSRVFTGNLACGADRLDGRVAFECIFGKRLPKLCFFSSKCSNDLLDIGRTIINRTGSLLLSVYTVETRAVKEKQNTNKHCTGFWQKTLH